MEPHDSGLDNALRVSPTTAHRLLHWGLVYYCPMCDSLHVSAGKTIQSIHDFLRA